MAVQFRTGDQRGGRPGPITTYGGTDGYIYISSTGGSGLLSTNWTSIGLFTSTNEDIVNLSASTYFLQITDINSCLYSDTFELTHPSSLSLHVDSVTNATCYDSCNGSINITANGGDSIYTYSWQGPNGFASNDEDIFNLCDGEYIITVDDGDTALIDTINIYQPQPFTTILSVNPILCYNGTAQAEINVLREEVELSPALVAINNSKIHRFSFFQQFCRAWIINYIKKNTFFFQNF